MRTTISAVVRAHLYVAALPGVVAAARRPGGTGDYIRVVLVGDGTATTRVPAVGDGGKVLHIPVGEAQSEASALAFFDRWLTDMDREIEGQGGRMGPSPAPARGAQVAWVVAESSIAGVPRASVASGGGRASARGRRGGRGRRRPDPAIAVVSAGQGVAGSHGTPAAPTAIAGSDPDRGAPTIPATTSPPVIVEDAAEASTVVEALAILRDRGMLRDGAAGDGERTDRAGRKGRVVYSSEG